MKIKRWLTPSISLLCLWAISMPLAAQDADTDAEESLMLEEVIVTATRVETTLMKTPVAVSAFDQDALTRVYEEIDELERTETEGILYTEYRELFDRFLIPGVLLLLLELLLAATRFRSLP